jgi:hypothetical protein
VVAQVPSDEPFVGYRSALDLPSFVELMRQIQGMKLLTRFVGREQRQEALRLEREVQALAATVDRFYSLLGERHWIYHDDLNVAKMATLVDAECPVDELERRFIEEHYGDQEWLRFTTMRLRSLPAMQPRMDQLTKALDDYTGGRYDVVVLRLLPVMDGFVNDLDPGNRRGLHTRESSELVAWDSVVGHHQGLAAAHRTFTKSFNATSSEPVLELHRNGILHGNLTNFDNVIVATKAWNRLFAVADWAKARQKQQTPKPASPPWRKIFEQLVENGRAKKHIAAWTPYALTPEHPEFTRHPAYTAASHWLAAWQGKKYGLIVRALPWSTQQSYGKRMAGEVRSMYQRHNLEAATIERARFRGAEHLRDSHWDDGQRLCRHRNDSVASPEG